MVCAPTSGIRVNKFQGRLSTITYAAAHIQIQHDSNPNRGAQFCHMLRSYNRFCRYKRTRYHPVFEDDTFFINEPIKTLQWMTMSEADLHLGSIEIFHTGSL